MGIALALTIAACDETFVPIEPSDLQFSVFGYLDASADTQWVRVMPIRPVQVTSPEPLGLTVTLEHTGTGRVVALRDSVFRFPGTPGAGSEGIFLHNFWTTEPIEPGATYRFTTAREGGTHSETNVEIPPEYDIEMWFSRSGEGLLWIDGLEHVAYSKTTVFYDDCLEAVEELPLRALSRNDNDPITVGLRAEPSYVGGCGPIEIEKRDLLVVGTSVPWPSGHDYSPGALGTTDPPSVSSISVGFLGGVLTQSVPFEACMIENWRGLPPEDQFCRLHYNELAATVRGTVRDVTCGGDVPRATITLREIHADPLTPRRVRTARSSRKGSFEIGALIGDQPYTLQVNRRADDGTEDFAPLVDTLTFAAGEQRSIELRLQSAIPCRR